MLASKRGSGSEEPARPQKLFKMRLIASNQCRFAKSNARTVAPLGGPQARPRWRPGTSQVRPRCGPGALQVWPSCPTRGFQPGPACTPSGPQLQPRWTLGGPQVDPRWTLGGPPTSWARQTLIVWDRFGAFGGARSGAAARAGRSLPSPPICGGFRPAYPAQRRCEAFPAPESRCCAPRRSCWQGSGRPECDAGALSTPFWVPAAVQQCTLTRI